MKSASSPRSLLSSPRSVGSGGKIPVRNTSLPSPTKTPLRPVQRPASVTSGAKDNSRDSASPPSENADAALLAEKAERLTKRLKFVEEQNKIKDHELNQLKSQISRLEKEKVKAQNEKSELAKQNQKLQSDVQRNKDFDKTKGNDVREAANKKKISELEEQLNKIKQKCEEIKTEKERLKQIMQKEIDKIKAEKTDVEQNYISKLENLETRRAKDIQQAKGETGKTLEKREKELHALKEEHKKAKEESKMTQQMIKQAEQKVANQKDAVISELEKKIEKSEGDVNRLKEEAVSREAEAEQVKQRFLTEINAISDSVENELQVKDNRIKELEEQLEELQQELNDEKQEYDNEIEEITTQHNEEIQVRDKQITEQKEEVQRLIESVHKVKAENSALTLEISDLKKQFSQLKAERDKALAQKHTELKKNENDFKLKLNETQKQYQEKLNKAQKQLNAYESELQKVKTESNELRATNKTINKEIATLKIKKQVLDKEQQTMEVEQEASVAISTQKELSSGPIKSEVIETKVIDPELLERLEKAEHDLEMTRAEVKELQNLTESLRGENEYLVNENMGFIERMKLKDEEVKGLLEGKSKDTDRMIELERENNTFPAKIQDLEMKYSQMCETAEEMSNRLMSLQKELQNREAIIFQLEDEIRRQSYTNNTKDMYLSTLESTANQVKVELLNLAKRVANIAKVVQEINRNRNENSSRIMQLEKENQSLRNQLHNLQQKVASSANYRPPNSFRDSQIFSKSTPDLSQMPTGYSNPALVNPRESKRVTDFQSWSRSVTDRLRAIGSTDSLFYPKEYPPYDYNSRFLY